MKKLEGKKLEIARLYELIDQTNRAIERHRSYPEPDDEAIEQFQELKDRFTKDLFQLLTELKLDFQLAA
ncbi:MAG: hypothetical protein KIS77_15935 [Saprospiraceae bacterium]|nr:hypothetical protein [Saprospiraceae bacterium]